MSLSDELSGRELVSGFLYKQTHVCSVNCVNSVPLSYGVDVVHESILQVFFHAFKPYGGSVLLMD